MLWGLIRFASKKQFHWVPTTYQIRPNYYTFKINVKTYTNMYPPTKSSHFGKQDQQITYLMVFMRVFFVVEGTHLNCIDILMQFKWIPTIYAFNV